MRSSYGRQGVRWLGPAAGALTVAVGTTVLTPSAARAQAVTSEAEAPSEETGLAEIVVTARKRDESIMRTPVVIQVITSQQIADLKIEDFKDLASVTPGLHILTAFGTVGDTVYLRGLGSGEGANFADQVRKAFRRLSPRGRQLSGRAYWALLRR